MEDRFIWMVPISMHKSDCAIPEKSELMFAISTFTKHFAFLTVAVGQALVQLLSKSILPHIFQPILTGIHTIVLVPIRTLIPRQFLQSALHHGEARPFSQ